jgi:hemolysin-activating ACP:hemolysin acyltransferase
MRQWGRGLEPVALGLGDLVAAPGDIVAPEGMILADRLLLLAFRAVVILDIDPLGVGLPLAAELNMERSTTSIAFISFASPFSRMVTSRSVSLRMACSAGKSATEAEKKAPGTDAPEEKTKGRGEGTGELAARFGEIVALLMRSPAYRHMALADLEWLVVPAILSGQFSIVAARGKNETDIPVPVGVAFWASVSDEVDRKLETQKKAGLMPFRLSPREWKSGDTVWLLDVITIPQIRKSFMEKLGEGSLKGKTVKHYFRDASEKPATQEEARLAS